ncbi:MAG: hypothetical protein FWD28_03880 [Treponema sp.]|nr:hypothetical protein [Treponema sp.]
MKKNIFIFLLLSILIFSGCNEPVFYTVSNETPPIPPLMPGGPTKFAAVGTTNLYVASARSLYMFDGNEWTNANAPPGSHIRDIAANGSTLYAVVVDGGRGRLMQSTAPALTTWTPSPWNSTVYTDIATVHLSGSGILVGASNPSRSDWATLNLNGSEVRSSGDFTHTGIVRASASSNFYITTKGIRSSTNGALVPGSENIIFTGITTIGSGTVAMSRDGRLFSVGGSVSEELSMERPSNSRGALLYWTDPTDTNNRILLAGTQDLANNYDASDTHGYMELVLSPTGGIVTGNTFKWPGTSPTTVENYERFVSSLRKHGLIDLVLFNNRLFASTIQNGVWSLKDHKDGYGVYWNAERNEE